MDMGRATRRSLRQAVLVAVSRTAVVEGKK